jgi:hypothetical protein
LSSTAFELSALLTIELVQIVQLVQPYRLTINITSMQFNPAGHDRMQAMSDELERAKVAILWTDMNMCDGAGIYRQPGMKCGYDEHGTFWCGCKDFVRKGNAEAHWLFVCAVKEQKVHLAPHGQGITLWTAFCKYLADTKRWTTSTPRPIGKSL